MKFLKIFSAVLFFSFLGGSNFELMAQREVYSKWASKLNVGDVIHNGDYVATLWHRKEPSGMSHLTLSVQKPSDRAYHKFIDIAEGCSYCNSFDVNFPNLGNEFTLSSKTAGGKQDFGLYSLKDDNVTNTISLKNLKLLNHNVKLMSYAFFLLESDGRLFIYCNDSGKSGEPRPIFEFLLTPKAEPLNKIGKWTRDDLKPGDYLELNGVKFIVGTNGLELTKNDAQIWKLDFIETIGRLSIEASGNMVVYSTSNTIIWQSGTKGGYNSRYLTLEDDGNLVLYSDSGTLGMGTGTPLWATGTCAGVLGGCGPVGLRNGSLDKW